MGTEERAMTKRTGGAALVAALAAGGVDTVFCVPGESYLAALDALIDSPIRVVTCRHEGGAAFMAEAYGKLTGKPAVCFVTRGPGACNAAIGLHTAKQDSTPLLLLIGQVARADRGREAFQEVDYRQMFGGGTAKAVYEAENAGDLPRLVAAALAETQAGRPGPVAISLPEDVLTDETDAPDAPPPRAVPALASDAQLEECRRLLMRAERPLAVIGGNTWQAGERALLQKTLEDWGLPVVTAFRRQDAIDNESSCYAGHLGTTVDAALLQAAAEADLVLALGTRIGDITTQGYNLWTPPRMAARLIHVYPEAKELGRVFQADLAIHAEMNAFARQLAGVELSPRPGWQARTAALHAQYLAWSTPRDAARFEPDMDILVTAADG